MAVPVTKVVGRPDPFTVVIIENIRLPVYIVGGVNVSVGGLTVVDHAQVYPHHASGAAFLSGRPYTFGATSGSGNIVTILVTAAVSGAGGAGGVGFNELPAGVGLSSFPLGLTAYGH